MLKKIIATTLVLFSVCVLADNPNEIKIQGEIVSVNATGQTFDIKDANNIVNSFKVTPATQFETKCDTCLIFKENILPIKFDALKMADWVEVKYKGDSVEKIADDVKIYKHK